MSLIERSLNWFPPWAILCSVGFCLADLTQASAADSETRDFTISIDGKKAGECHVTFCRQDNGQLTVSGQADVKVNYLVYSYTYSFRGIEVWKGGRLMRLTSTANDNGKPLAVTAVADNQSLRINANGKERTCRPDVWTTTYWQLADAKLRNRAILLLDADTAKEINGTLQYVGTSPINVAGRAESCSHYRVTGGADAKLWYDARERLVRQESTEDGHKTLLELAQIHK